jgi:hypothetical protein
MQKTSPLDNLLKNAYETAGSTETVNKFYVTLFRTNLFMPVTIDAENNNSEEPFTPLYIKQDEYFFVPVFDSLERLQSWAGETQKKFDHVAITGEALLRGLGSKAYLCLNIGTPFYKEFSPEEITRLKLTIAKMDKLRKAR